MAKTSIVKSFLKQTPIYLSAIVLGIILGMAIQMAYAAWTNPTTFPPNNNAPAPINVSTTTQTKAGSLIVATASGSYLGIGDNAYRLEKDGDSLAFVNKGGETKMIIGNDGNVGIGTTAPGGQLSLSNKLTFETNFGSPDRGHLRIGDGTGWKFHITKNDDTKLVTFQDNGNVGIGTTVPTQKLDVTGNVKANDYYIASTHKWVSSLGSGGSLWTKSGSNIYYNSGNVGIGTASPGAKLDIDGDLKVRGYINYQQRGCFKVTSKWGQDLMARCPVGYYVAGVTGWYGGDPLPPSVAHTTVLCCR